MPKINSLEVVHQDTNKDSYDNLHDILVALKDAVGLIKEGKDYSVNKEIIDGKARAAYEVLLEMYVNDKEAFARRLETLTAEFGTSIAKVLEEWTVYASATEAYAKKIEEVSAKAFQNEAKVTEEMFARVTADEALAKLITKLEADFNDSETRSRAAIREEQIVRANATEALASRSFVMEASIAENNALILEEQIVRAAEDSALASSITTLSATVGTKNKTYYQSTAPTSGMTTGDLWIDTDDNKLYRYNISFWQNIQDNQIGINTAAITSEASTRATADAANASAINAVTARLDTGDFATVKTQAEASVFKNRVYAQTSQPTGGTYTTGDLWVDTDADNKTYRYNGTTWVLADRTVVQTFSQTTAPTAVNLGDLWVDTDGGNLLSRWNGSSWVAVDDSRIGATATRVDTIEARLDTGDFATVKTTSEATALKVTPRANLAADLSTWTQDGTVNSVTQSVMPIIQSETPIGTFTAGTYWFDSNNNYKMYMYNGTSWVAVTTSVLVFANTPWGEAVIGNAASTYYIESPYFSVTAGSTYTVSADIMNYSSVGNVYCDIRFYSSTGTLLKDGTQNSVAGVKAFSDTDTNRNAIAVADTAPTSATQAKARFVVTGVTNFTVGVRQIKVELGGLPATAFTALNYASAKWGIKTNANGYVSGIELNSDSTGTSEFVVAAEKFKVKKPDGTDGISWNGTNSRLDISGDVYANNFYGNVVGTGNINTNAVSIPASQQSSDARYGDGGLQVINQINHTMTSAGSVLVIFNGRQNYDSGARNTGLALYIDGTEIVPLNIAGAINDYANVSWSGNLAAGTHIIQIAWHGQDSSVRISNRTLSVLGTMR